MKTISLKVETNQSKLQVALAARTRAFKNGSRLLTERNTLAQNGFVASMFEIDVTEGDAVRLEKIIALYTSRDPAISECGSETLRAVRRAETFDSIASAHRGAWYRLWQRFEVNLESAASEEEDIQHIGMIVHLYAFHVLQTTSTNTMSMALDVGAPARGWHGEAYRGHIFWDELFVFPMINLRLPEITKSLLMYRYRRLDAARRAARRAGYRGAMYPWQSGSNGREESQELHLNPKSGRWIPDRSHRQRHVNAAIAYNLYQYYQASRDMEFLRFYGAEMMLEIARFWAAVAQYNPRLDRYEILGVMGPDEYHDGYPDAEEGGLDNNAYTNIMAVWVLDRARELLDLLPIDVRTALRDKLDLTDEELARWTHIGRRMRVVFLEDGIISQFEGYGDLEEFDWDGYREKYGDIQRLDRILEAEDDSPNHYKVSKQADVLMLFYLLSAEELSEIFEKLDYPFAYDTIPKNIDYYMARTSHGSTPQPGGACLGAGPEGPARFVASLLRSLEERYQRYPGRHHARRHPPGRHGRGGGPDPARLHRHRHPPGCALVQPVPAMGTGMSAIQNLIPSSAAGNRNQQRNPDGYRAAGPGEAHSDRFRRKGLRSFPRRNPLFRPSGTESNRSVYF